MIRLRNKNYKFLKRSKSAYKHNKASTNKTTKKNNNIEYHNKTITYITIISKAYTKNNHLPLYKISSCKYSTTTWTKSSNLIKPITDSTSNHNSINTFSRADMKTTSSFQKSMRSITQLELETQ